MLDAYRYPEQANYSPRRQALSQYDVDVSHHKRLDEPDLPFTVPL